jgi:lipid-binding SYLF domain-containing protein
MSPALANPYLKLISLGSLILGLAFSQAALAGTAAEIDSEVDDALVRFTREVKGADTFLKSAKGFLVFPKVYKAGFVVGGEYGKGALRIAGVSKDYYELISASYGLQLGAQARTVVIAFLTDEALRKFQDSSGWKAGVDGSVALADLGAGGLMDTNTIREPIVGFVFGQAGLMYNLTLEGSYMNKLYLK